MGELAAVADDFLPPRAIPAKVAWKRGAIGIFCFNFNRQSFLVMALFSDKSTDETVVAVRPPCHVKSKTSG